MNIDGFEFQCGPHIKEGIEKGHIKREDDPMKVFDIRTLVAKSLSKIKRKDVNVFDQCIAYTNDPEKGGKPDSFEICFVMKGDSSKQDRLVHLTGYVTENLIRRSQWD